LKRNVATRVLLDWIAGLTNPDCNPFFGFDCIVKPISKNGFGFWLSITHLQRIWIGLTIQKNWIVQYSGRNKTLMSIFIIGLLSKHLFCVFSPDLLLSKKIIDGFPWFVYRNEKEEVIKFGFSSFLQNDNFCQRYRLIGISVKKQEKNNDIQYML